MLWGKISKIKGEIKVMQEILDKIISECPKSWAEWGKTIPQGENGISDKPYFTIYHDSPNEINYVVNEGCDKVNIDYNFRNLYDYFDKLDIRVYILPCVYGNTINGEFEITYRFKYMVFDFESNGYDTRIEAEWNAFYEAFKIRESQLN